MLESLLAADAAARTWLASLHFPALDILMYGLSLASLRAGVWLALGIVLVIRHPWRRGALLQLALALLLSNVLVDYVLKPAVTRPRPFVGNVELRVVGYRPVTHSFPSGHAASAAVGAFVLSRTWRRGRVFFWSLAAAIGFSRIYLGVHYPLDVIAGGLLGVAVAAFVTGGAGWADAEPASPASAA